MTTEQKNSETRLPGTSPAPAPAAIEPSSSSPTLAEFAKFREAAFARLREATPDRPITLAELIHEVATLRSERSPSAPANHAVEQQNPRIALKAGGAFIPGTLLHSAERPA
jgi:hypothetical protein